VVGIAPYVAEILRPLQPRAFVPISDTGVERLPDAVDRSAHHGTVHLLYVGRLVRTKGARDAIRAMSLLRDLPVTLDIVGDGFDRSACESLVGELVLESRITFHGRLPRADIDDIYRTADIFVFPSYREPGGHVVAEAMGFGLPLIVSDRGGPGYIVDETCGIRVTPVEPEQYSRDIAAAVRTLVIDPVRRQELGHQARKRIGEIAVWDSKVLAMKRVYQDVLERQ